MRKLLFFVLLPLFVFLSSCATRGDLHKLTRQVLVLQTELEGTQSKQSQFLLKSNQLKTEIEKLARIFDSFKKKGQYNFANIGGKLDELRTHHQELLGKYQVTQKDFDSLKKQHEKLLKSYALRFGDPTASDTSNSSVAGDITPQALFQAAKALFDAGRYRDARERFKLFKEKFPNDALTDDAYIYLGDCLNKLEKPLMAIIWYDNVRKKFESGDKIPDALLRLGETHFKIKACPEGKAFLRRLVRKHKNSPLVSQAKMLLRNAHKLCKK